MEAQRILSGKEGQDIGKLLNEPRYDPESKWSKRKEY